METTHPGSLTILHDSDKTRLICGGSWTLEYIPQLTEYLEKLDPKTPLEWDMGDIEHIDTAGVALQALWIRKFSDQGISSHQVRITPSHASLQALLYPDLASPRFVPSQTSWLERFGRHVYHIAQEQYRFFTYLGEAIAFFVISILHPSRIRYRSIIANLYAVGVSALPIVLLSAFLIGIVITYQSIVVLQKYGADLYIVDMAGVSLTRELAPLITAIVVAGRSGSAFTAQIGVMKITQEIDAMKTMGFNPFFFLVWPRVIALMIAMPLLIFFADIVGIMGSMLIAHTQSNLSYGEFIHRLQSTLALKHFIIGISKGPFFAFLIAITATFRGFQVSYNTESIGLYTTKSVVNSIFLVIACDALFSILLTEFKL